MKQLLILICFSLFAMAQSQNNGAHTEPYCSGEEISLSQYRWENRIIVLFSSDSGSESYQAQMSKFSSLEDEFLDRDLILISIFDDDCSVLNDKFISDSSADSIRANLTSSGNNYSVYLIGKDGGVKLRQEAVIEPEELFRVIDRMPMRRREMSDGR
jgi:glutathione peroxidase-family protein